MSAIHEYSVQLLWEGNLGDGTSRYDGYSRTWRVRIEGKTNFVGTADPTFHGERDTHNPKALSVASLSS